MRHSRTYLPGIIVLTFFLSLAIVGCGRRQKDVTGEAVVKEEDAQKSGIVPQHVIKNERKQKSEPEISELKSDDLEIVVTLDEKSQPGVLADAIERDLELKLKRRTAKGFKGTLRLGVPEGPDIGAQPKTLAFDLTKSETATLKTTLSVPEGLGITEFMYPIHVAVGDQDYLSMDLYVVKGHGTKVIGPFDGGPRTKHDTVHPPEKGIDFGAVYEGQGGRTIRWRPFSANDIQANGYVDLNLACYDANQAAAYIAIDVHVPRAMKAKLLLGSDDSCKVWHNSKLVHSNPIVVRGAEPAQDTVPLSLTEDTNTFLLKICDNWGGWGYFFELVDENGKPIDGLQEMIALSRVYPRVAKLRLSEVTRTSATATWNSDVPARGRLTFRRAIQDRAIPRPGPLPKSNMVKPDPKAKPIVVRGDLPSMRHTATVRGLEPGTRYIVTAEPAIGNRPSQPLSFYTAPPEGKTQVLHVKTVAVICTNVVDEKHADKEGANTPAPDELVERLKWEIKQTVLFWYINSGMRFMVDLEYFVDDRPYAMPGDIWHGIAYSEHNENEKLFKEVLARHGKTLSDYDMTIMPCFTKYWDERGQKFSFGDGGGGTLGIQSETGLGKCGWRASARSNSAWLMSHEGQHQIDSLYHESMGPEHLFCHFQPWDDTAHRHGEHWDGIGWIFWEWAGYVTREHQGYPLLEPTLGFRYFTSRWGTVKQYNDADNDGIPDNAPKLAMDEKRFGSSPTKADTDSDGLNDMMEVMACRWIDYGHGYTWGGPTKSHHCNPRDPDTDKDGLKDGVDPYPIYNIDPQLKKAPNDKGQIARKDFRAFTRFEDTVYKADYYLAWNDDYLVIGIEAPSKPGGMRICLDLDDDGWFVGSDNYDLELHPHGGGGHGERWHGNADGTLTYGFHNCGVVGQWPFYDPDGLTDSEIELVQGETGGVYRAEIHIPKNKANGLDLVKGEQIGIMLTINPEGGIKRKWQHNQLSVFEPHSFFTFQLAK